MWGRETGVKAEQTAAGLAALIALTTPSLEGPPRACTSGRASHGLFSRRWAGWREEAGGSRRKPWPETKAKVAALFVRRSHKQHGSEILVKAFMIHTHKGLNEVFNQAAS